MSKNSFTKNFNSCVAGFPIASVAAHMVLHEGLGKDLLKVGVPAAILAGLYNYGDDMATGISNWGKEHEDMKLGNWNIGQTAQDVGNKLNDWHNAGTHWMQDSFLGKAAGLGGQEALQRQTEEQGASEYLAQAAQAKQQEINDINRTITDPAARATAIQQVENKYNSQAKAAGDYAWQQKLAKINGAQQGQQPQQPQGQQPQQQGQAQPGAEQFGPPRPNPIQAAASAISGQARSQQIAASLPNATKTAVSGATAGAAAGSAFATPPTKSSVQDPFGALPTVGGVNGKSYSLVKPEMPAEQPPTDQSQQVQQPMQAGGSNVPEPRKESNAPPTNQTLRVPPSAPQPGKKLQFDYNKYNQQAMAIPAGSEFGLTAPEATSNTQQQPQQPQQLPQARVSVGDNIYQNPTLQQRELVKPNIPLQQQQQPAQPMQRMQLNATPQAAQRLLGNRPSMATGTDANLNNTQDPVFNGKRRQFLNGANFDTHNELKGSTLGGSFTPNQNQSKPSPFGSRK